MAWTEKLPSGKFRGGWRDPVGNKHYTKRATHPEHPYDRRGDARKAAQDAEVRARREAAARKGTLAASTLWGTWWDLIAEKRVKPDTDAHLIEFRIVERYLRPRWGGEPLNLIEHGTYQDWIDALTLGRCAEWKRDYPPQPSYVHRIHAVFRWSIGQAMRGKNPVLHASPCAGVQLPKIRKKRKPFLDPDHAAAMGEHLRDDYQDAVDFDLETGLRPGELCGLHANRVDLVRQTAAVCEVLVARKRVIRGYPKDKDARLVPLTAKAVEIAKRRLEGRDLNTGCGLVHTDGTDCTSPLVFLTDLGRPIHADVLADRMRVAAKKAEVPRRSPYAARRGFATRAAEGGLDAFQLAEVMGHADITQTQEYVQETSAAHARVLAALGDRAPLSVVDGTTAGADSARGADRGAQPEWETGKDSGPATGESAG